ncbi:MAG: aldehyde dehydrogenase family protein [Candidatus Hydrogenedens sp.]|nr:aldehyde dehydrogenase family protein [Candidatus Hydrogenedens sp.]
MCAVASDYDLSQRTLQFLSSPRQQLIGGKWVDSASGQTFGVVDPATGEEVVQVARGNAADIDAAVAAARKAFESGPWHSMTPSERGKLIWKLGDLIESHARELAELETLDNGKPFAIAQAADVALAADQFRYYAGWATKLLGDSIPISVVYAPGTEWQAYSRREPIGVVGQIIPWNFPLLMAAWKLAPALTCGCTVVLKPAEQTPLSALYLGQLICEAGFPDGVVNIVNGFGEETGAPLASHPGVDKVAFTGSTEVGKLIVQAAAGNLKKVTLELGGKSPNVVFSDADLASAVPGAASAIFFNHGQCCAAGSRLFIEHSIFDDVVNGVAGAAKQIKVGSGFQADTQMGPLVSQEQFDRVTAFMEAGLAAGAEALAGGGRVGTRGYFVEPTVFVNTNHEMKIVREEIFGPVVTAMPFKDIDEIAAVANNTNYGLASGIWTKDISKAHKLAKRLRAGTVWINCYNIFDAALPFGGYKESGWGREMGHEALNNYLETKAVCIQL